MRSFGRVVGGSDGPLIIAAAEAPRVDRARTWVPDDWRLTSSAEISEDFGNGHDLSHNGRVGNTVTINGYVPESFRVQPGERVRLRPINAAHPRILGPDLHGHQPIVIPPDAPTVPPPTPHAPPPSPAPPP